MIAIKEAGLVHRDIKPSNILLDDHDVAKLADFGLSRTVSYEDKISQSGDIFGTPAYMSPEHAQGNMDLDIRTDIYSLAATGYAMLTGRQPYEGRSATPRCWLDEAQTCRRLWAYDFQTPHR